MAAQPPGGKQEKEPPNIVHQNAIFRETIHKEQRNQKLYTNYGVNPYKKMYVLAGKPNSTHDSADGEEDGEFLRVYHNATKIPKEKYTLPQTASQEIGWDITPLIEQVRDDQRFHHPRQSSEITKFMDAFWKQKEQENIQQQQQ